MKYIWKEILFMITWFISKSASEIVCGPFSYGPIGEIVHSVKELLYDSILLYFIFTTLMHNLNEAVPSCRDRHNDDRRRCKRSYDHRQVMVDIIGNGLNLEADTINRSQTGIMVVLANNMRKFISKGMILQIESDFYRVVWGRVQGLQYQVGLQRQSI